MTTAPDTDTARAGRTALAGPALASAARTALAAPALASTDRTSRRRRASFALVLAVGGMLALTSCAAATSDAADSAPSGSADRPAEGGGTGGGGMGFGGGGVTGEIAAVSDTTLQVQDAESQTAVSYTADTDISRSVDAAMADVTIGSCVSVMGMPPAQADTDSDDTAGGSGDDAAATTDPALAVTISQPVDGECTTGFGGMAPPTDLPADIPSDMPSDMPTPPEGDGAGGDGQGRMGIGFGGASGIVTATADGTITVDQADADGTVTSVDILVDDATTFTATISADSSALVAGECVVAMGESDDSGTVAATQLTVSAAGDDGCVTAMGRPGQGQGAPGSTDE